MKCSLTADGNLTHGREPSSFLANFVTMKMLEWSAMEWTPFLRQPVNP
jgi:hypothetical protein